MTRAITASDIKIALRRLYAQPEWALLFEVGDATGARHTRFADALAMSLWPSRGLTLTGMEIKVSRSDWKKERAQPEKAETIAAFCDYWQLVTGPKVVLDTTEIPPAWGWLEFNGDRFTTRKTPEKTEAQPITRTFLAALLRRAHKTDEAMIAAEVQKHTEINDASFELRVEQAAARKAGTSAELQRKVAEFEAASGLKIDSPAWGGPTAHDLGRVAKAVLSSGIDHSFRSLHVIAHDLRKMSDALEKAMADIGLPPERGRSIEHFRRRK